MLDIVASYHRIQFQGKLMAKTQENGKKSHIGPDLGPLSSNSDCIFFFPQKIWLSHRLDIMVSYYYVKYQKKLMIQS